MHVRYILYCTHTTPVSENTHKQFITVYLHNSSIHCLLYVEQGLNQILCDSDIMVMFHLPDVIINV